MDRKIIEKRILEKVLKKNYQDYQILENYPQWNGENPDWIISNGKETIGVELFYLTLKKTPKNFPYVNLAHRNARISNKITRTYLINTILSLRAKRSNLLKRLLRRKSAPRNDTKMIC